MKKLIVKTLKPRNPLVVASRLRRAGVHRSSGGAQRQQARHMLRQAVQDLPPRRP